jgi:hypothetical protein
VGLFSPSSCQVERQEKCSLGANALLNMTVILLIVSNLMPKSAMQFPLLGWFIVVEMASKPDTHCVFLVSYFLNFTCEFPFSSVLFFGSELGVDLCGHIIGRRDYVLKLIGGTRYSCEIIAMKHNLHALVKIGITYMQTSWRFDSIAHTTPRSCRAQMATIGVHDGTFMRTSKDECELFGASEFTTILRY